jgi:Gpi18-like mannosyltransferase
VNKKEITVVTILLILGFIIRIAISNNPGFAWDVWTHQSWAKSLYMHGLLDAYKQTSSNLPPVFMYVLYLISYPTVKLKGYSFLFLKLPGIIFDIGISLMIYLFVKRKLEAENPSNSSALICMAIFLFNPATIFASAIWGKYDDSLLSFLLLLTIYHYNSYKEGIFYSLSILTKLQGIVLAPILLRKKPLKLIIPFVLTSVLVLMPFLSHIEILYQNIVIRSLDQFPHITINAYNFWWLFNWTGWGKEWFNAPSDTTLYFFISPKLLGLFVFVVVSILLIIYVRENNYKLRPICFASFLIYFTFFMFLTRIHERYMFYCLPFLALTVSDLDNKKFLCCYFILSTTFFLNIYIVYEQNFPNYFPSLYKLSALTTSISLLNLFVYIYFLILLIRSITHGHKL